MIGERSRAWAIAAGALARRLLVVEGCHGTVEAVLKNVVYLATASGELLWLSTDGQVPHRRYVRISYGLPEIEPGMSFSARDGVLRIGDDLRIEMTQAMCWSPPWEWPGAGLTREEARVRLGTLFAAVQHVLEPSSEGGFLRLVAGPSWGGTEAVASHPYLDAASAAVERLRSACRERNLPDVLEVGLELVGLGPGLTPAGDDFLGGLLFTLLHLHHTSASLTIWDEERVAGFLAIARPFTGWISHTLLSDLARGHGPGPLHDLVGNVLSPAPAPALAACVDQLCRIGHSSGRDLLAGALAATWTTEVRNGGTR